MMRGAGTSQRSHAGGKEGRPREAFALAAPVEPHDHQSLRKVREVPDAIRVANDSVVVPVPLQLASEGGDECT
jgi:hypothetical protein